MYNTTNQNLKSKIDFIKYPTAKIAVNKNVCKDYQNKIFLKDNTEFSIELFNPKTNSVGAWVSIDGNPLGNYIIVKPGQRIFLERFLTDSKKFKFSTYSVENSKEVNEIIQKAKNGVIEIKFYDEKVTTIMPVLTTYPYWNPYTQPYYNSTCDVSENTLGFCNDINISDVVDTRSRDFSNEKSLKDFPKEKESGRTEKGSNSYQNFSNVEMELESFVCASYEYQLLPESEKQIVSEDIKVFCTECGTKQRNDVWKFCPKCGTKY